MMRRRRNRAKEVATVAVVVIGMTAAALVFHALVTIGAPPKPQPTYFVEYMVKPGDTIWSIADKIAKDTSNREIGEIQRENQLINSYIMPGQKLLVPIKENID